MECIRERVPEAGTSGERRSRKRGPTHPAASFSKFTFLLVLRELLYSIKMFKKSTKLQAIAKKVTFRTLFRLPGVVVKKVLSDMGIVQLEEKIIAITQSDSAPKRAITWLYPIQ
ncbi:hypothetical protein ACJJTC_011347 [Scirpophaga incertulas]